MVNNYGTTFNMAHLHLLVNHVPIVLLPALFISLVYFQYSKNISAVRFTLVALIFTGFMTGASYFTGEPAEKTINGFPAVTEEVIEPHEDAALASLIIVGIACVTAVATLALRKNEKLEKVAFYSTTVLVLFASMAMAKVGYLGGQIRHTEVRDVKQKFND